MNNICLHSVLPHFISDARERVSEIWRSNVTFRRGESCLVSATSGAGKSSLLSYIYGERTDYSGEICFDGSNIEKLRGKDRDNIRQRHIGIVFQGLRLFPELTAWENIAIKNRLTRHKTDEEIRQLIVDVKLGDKINEKAAKLSFGQQQRIAILRALCQPFDFLLLDEPFSHLDEGNIRLLTEIIDREVQSRNAGLIVCSLGQEYLFNYQSRFNL
jgi:ABC-type lipoprotein export system ATPase subunit